MVKIVVPWPAICKFFTGASLMTPPKVKVVRFGALIVAPPLKIILLARVTALAPACKVPLYR